MRRSGCDGQEYLLPNGARGVTAGRQSASKSRVRRSRAPSHGSGRSPGITDETSRARSRRSKERSLPFPSPDDRLDEAGWSDLLEEARSGIVRFAGGELRISLTPAMTLIDVDGHLPPFELAMAGGRAAARAILRHGIGGSIGIDLPTISGKDAAAGDRRGRSTRSCRSRSSAPP